MPKRIGFFHFGSREKRRPLKSLETSLSETSIKDQRDDESINDSLIVLPEGFNIATEYEPGRSSYPTEQAIIPSLKDLAARFGVVFVAGLILTDAERRPLPYNSAYLITSTSCELLSRKQGKDDMAGILYDPCNEAFNKPIPYEQMCVAALICIDATVFPYPHLSYISNRQLHERVRTKIEKLARSSAVLCVPANTRYFETAGISREWTDLHFVLANAGSKPSVIRTKGRDPISFSGETNQVILVPFGF